MNFRFNKKDFYDHNADISNGNIIKNEIVCTYFSHNDDKLVIYCPNFLNRIKFESILEKMGIIINTIEFEEQIIYKMILKQELNVSLAFFYYQFYYIME